MKRIYLWKLVCFMSFLIGVTWHTDAQISLIQGINCPGDSTGKLGVVSPSFGTGPYTYLWSNGKTTQSIAGVKAGTYSVTVTDNLGATQNFSYKLNNPPVITTSPVIINNSSWPVNSGKITMNGTGGTGWLSYELLDSINYGSKLSSDGVFAFLPSGTYYITTKDMNQCPKRDTIRVKENAVMILDSTVDYTACYNSTAPISVSPKSNKTPITVNFGDTTIIIKKIISGSRYILSTNDTVSSIEYDALPGFHILTVSDAVNKGARFAWNVDSTSAPITVDWIQRDISCHTGNNGQINITARGSYENFVYQWSGPNGFTSTNNNIDNLVAGRYRLHVEDANNKDDSHCTLDQTIVLTGPDRPLYVVFDDPIQPRCRFTADGMIKIRRVDGAEAPISYLWSDGQKNKDADSLRAGKYIVSVTDANGCTTQDSLVLKPGNRCMYNIVTPNGDGYNDYLDLTDLCKDFQMKAIVVDQHGKTVKQLSENNPRWDPNDLGYLPTGTASTFTVFFQLFKNGKLYGSDGVSFSVLFEKK